MFEYLAEKTDEELAVLSLTDQAGFVELVDRYQKRLLNYILRISGFSYEESEDILQEVFIKVYKNLNAFNADLKFSSWIYRITHNHVISYFRKYHKIQKLSVELNDLVLENLSSDFQIDQSVDRQILKQDIEVALAGLDNKYKDVLILRYAEECDYQEISDILKKPIGTVSALINRAKAKIKKNLQQYERQ